MDLRHCKGRIVKLFLKRKRDKVQEDTGRAVHFIARYSGKRMEKTATDRDGKEILVPR